MFEYLESDANRASNLPPSHSAKPQPRPERVRHLLYGSLANLDRTINPPHANGYADPNDVATPSPCRPAGPGQ
jgi:hypothetical protein